MTVVCIQKRQTTMLPIMSDQRLLQFLAMDCLMLKSFLKNHIRDAYRPAKQY